MGWYQRFVIAAYDDIATQNVLALFNQGKSVYEISFSTGISQGTIRSILQKNNVQPTTIQDANKNPNKRKGVIYNTGDSLPEFAKKFITDNAVKRGPYWLTNYLHLPIGAIVKYIIEQELPMQPTYLRYVPYAYQQMWQMYNQQGVIPEGVQRTDPSIRPVRPTGPVLPNSVPSPNTGPVQTPPNETLPNPNSQAEIIKFITENININPSTLGQKLNLPIGTVVKYIIDNKLPLKPVYLRYVGGNYRQKWQEYNPNVALPNLPRNQKLGLK